MQSSSQSSFGQKPDLVPNSTASHPPLSSSSQNKISTNPAVKSNTQFIEGVRQKIENCAIKDQVKNHHTFGKSQPGLKNNNIKGQVSRKSTITSSM